MGYFRWADFFNDFRRLAVDEGALVPKRVYNHTTNRFVGITLANRRIIL